MTILESPFSGDSIYIRKDDPKFFPDEFNLDRLNQVVENLKRKGWKEGFKDPDGAGINDAEGSTDDNIVAILYK